MSFGVPRPIRPPRHPSEWRSWHPHWRTPAVSSAGHVSWSAAWSGSSHPADSESTRSSDMRSTAHGRPSRTSVSNARSRRSRWLAQACGVRSVRRMSGVLRQTQPDVVHMPMGLDAAARRARFTLPVAMTCHSFFPSQQLIPRMSGCWRAVSSSAEQPSWLITRSGCAARSTM